jgi:dCMP deaminase
MTTIAYVPAYHQAYAAFFAKNKGPIYILDTSLVKELYPKAERDIRAVPARDMAMLLSGLWADVHVLDTDTLASLGISPIAMPDEDISHLFAKKYLPGKKVTFVPTHLRWDGWGATKETPIPPDRIVSVRQLDRALMARALAVAQKSPDWWRQVGAVVARASKPILIGHNRPNYSDAYSLNAMGDPRSHFDAGVSYDLTTAEHGEAYLIGLAARKGLSLNGAHMYVTTFPCPTCAKLIATAGIKKVYYAEGYSLVDAEEVLRDAGVEIILVKL